MTVLLDTSVAIDLLLGNRAALDAVRGAVGAGHDLAASVVVKVEVLAGMRPHEEHATRRLLDDIIAATAHATTTVRQDQDVQLWTRNIKHFPMFANLAPPS